MPPSETDQPLPYAEPGVRTAPPRTLLRIVGRWVWNVIRWVTLLIQTVLLGLGYLVIGVAIALRVVLVAVATALLFAGRVRWNGPAVRVWVVRSFNRAWIATSGPFRRYRDRVPLATPHASR